MDIQEEKVDYGSVGTKEHFKISRRDTLLNDLRNSTAEGLIALSLSVTSVIFILAGIFMSYRRHGEMGYSLGILMIAAGLFAVAGIVLAAFGFKRRNKVRHYMEKRALVVSITALLALTALFVRGLILFLS